MGEFVVNNHQRATIAIKKWVSMSEISHNLAWLPRHELSILSKPESVIDRGRRIVGMGEKVSTPRLADSDGWSRN